jgi:hypothetical protein
MWLVGGEVWTERAGRSDTHNAFSFEKQMGLANA